MLHYNSLESMREKLYNNGMDLTTLDNEKFIIVDGWNSLEKIIAPMFKAYLQDYRKIDFDKILAFLFVEHDYTLIDSNDLAEISYTLKLAEMLEAGQLSFVEFIVPPKKVLDNYHSIMIDFQQWREDNQYQDKEINSDMLKEYNQEIIDDMDNIEWGFSDEYSTCGNCYKAIRTSPDCYSWRPDFILDENGYLCKECCLKDSESLLEDNIQKIQDAINEKHDTLPTINDLFTDMICESNGWYRIIHPYDNNGYKSSFESGFHPGQADNPSKQCQYIKSILPQDEFLIVPVITGVGQFDVSWDIYIKRINPGNNYGIVYDDLLIAIGEGLLTNGRDKHSPGDLMAEALKHLSTNFAKIQVDSGNDTVSIKSFDNIQEYLDDND